MKNAKKVSHTDYWRAQFEADEVAVMFFTGMDLNDLTNLKMDMGKEWLMKHLKEHCFTANEVESMWMDKRMLQWWNLNWRNYDHYTILPILHRIKVSERVNVYRDMHLNVFSEEHPECIMLQVQLTGVLELLTKEEEVSDAA